MKDWGRGRDDPGVPGVPAQRPVQERDPVPVGRGHAARRAAADACPAGCVHRPDLAKRRRRVRGRPAGTVLAGVRFRPGAGGAALGLPLSELLDLRVDAGDLPALARGLLPGSLAPEEALRRLPALAAALVPARPGAGLVREAARLLDRPGARAE